MTIVVGYVPTREGRAALRRAGEEATAHGVDLVVVTSERTTANAASEENRDFEARLAQVKSDLETAQLGVEVSSGASAQDVSDNLLDVADQRNAAAIVIGLRRRSPVGKLILGSAAQRILLEASCPVLAVKATDQD